MSIQSLPCCQTVAKKLQVKESKHLRVHIEMFLLQGSFENWSVLTFTTTRKNLWLSVSSRVKFLIFSPRIQKWNRWSWFVKMFRFFLFYCVALYSTQKYNAWFVDRLKTYKLHSCLHIALNMQLISQIKNVIDYFFSFKPIKSKLNFFKT